MASITREELLRLARTGAVARLAELQEEIASIHETFPDLKSGVTAPRPAAVAKAAKPTPAPTPAAAARGGQANRAWSAAARKAVSERMKRYWAGRRAKAAKASK